MPKPILAAELERIKQSVDLVALIEARGVKLKKTGKSYKALCPFHQEKTPSFTVTPAKGLWHCFGCGKGGDAIRFVELLDGITFPEAVKRLTGESVPVVTHAVRETPTPTISPTQRAKLLNRVAGFYHQRFLDQPEGLRYLSKVRGIQNVSLFKSYRVGLADGALLDALPNDDESRALFKALGVITDKGRELFNGCVVFPLFDEHGNVVNLYGRRIEDGEYNHFYLPPPRGLWNYQAAKRSSSILLTESVIDAMTLVDRGFADVMPCYGVNGLTEDLLAWFERCHVQDITLCFDADSAGRDGADKAAARLSEKNITVHTVALPDGEDINSFLNRRAVADFHARLAAVAPQALPAPTPASATASPIYQPTAHGFTLKLGDRHYDIKAIARSGTQLKATIKASGEKSNGFELHTLDLYSQRSRETFARSCAGLFEMEETLIKNDLAQVLEHVETWQPPGSQPKTIALSEADKAEALGFLKSPDLLTLIQHDLTTLGVAGEELNKLLCYLACVSRKLDDPLSLLIQSRSAAGKSTLQNAVILLVPDEDKVVYTRMTDQSLFYQDENALVHKVLALEEAEGLGGAAYSLRALQSSKSLNIATTTKDPATGKMKTEHYHVNGPVAVLLTTTQPDLDEETRSRFLTLTIDESARMTEAIFVRQRHADTLEGYMQGLERSAIVTRHHAVQRLLEPLAVINPYADQLTFSAHSLRARRDHKKYLMLIKVVAFLHQKQREVKETRYRDEPLRYIEVTRDDIRKANTLAQHVLGNSLDELSAPARKLLKEIHAMVKTECEQKKVAARDVIFTRRTIREHIGWSDWQVRTHIHELEQLEYLRARSGAWGKEYVYELTNDALDTEQRLVLADPDQLKEPPQ
jgi:DNA primase catalytic core